MFSIRSSATDRVWDFVRGKGVMPGLGVANIGPTIANLSVLCRNFIGSLILACTRGQPAVRFRWRPRRAPERGQLCTSSSIVRRRNLGHDSRRGGSCCAERGAREGSDRASGRWLASGSVRCSGQRNAVDTAPDLCSTGSHERRLPLTEIRVLSQTHDPTPGTVFRTLSPARALRFMQSWGLHPVTRSCSTLSQSAIAAPNVWHDPATLSNKTITCALS
jgi:hypothetical protein